MFGAPSYLLYAAGAVAVGLIIIFIFHACWHVAEPNEALIISGRRKRGRGNSAAGVDESMQFDTVTGHGRFAIPMINVVRKLDLNLIETELDIDCVTKQASKS